MVKAPCFQCKGREFDLGTKIPHVMWCSQENVKNRTKNTFPAPPNVILPLYFATFKQTPIILVISTQTRAQNSAQCFPHPNPNFESKVGGKQSQGHETAESRTLNATRSGERAWREGACRGEKKGAIYRMWEAQENGVVVPKGGETGVVHRWEGCREKGWHCQ